MSRGDDGDPVPLNPLIGRAVADVVAAAGLAVALLAGLLILKAAGECSPWLLELSCSPLFRGFMGFWGLVILVIPGSRILVLLDEETVLLEKPFAWLMLVILLLSVLFGFVEQGLILWWAGLPLFLWWLVAIMLGLGSRAISTRNPMLIGGSLLTALLVGGHGTFADRALVTALLALLGSVLTVYFTLGSRDLIGEPGEFPKQEKPEVMVRVFR